MNTDSVPPSEHAEEASSPSVILTQRAQEVVAELERATGAAFALLHDLTQARRDGDEWTRMPSPSRKERCPVSKLSRSSIERLCAEDKIRRKTVSGAVYYSLADMRNHIRRTQ